MSAALRLWWLLQRREQNADLRPTILSVLAFAVASCAFLVTAGGIRAFVERSQARPGWELGPIYIMLAAIAGVLLAVPILTLGGVAARLTASRRDARLATMRLAGATSGQVVTVTLAESAAQAAAGAVLGAVGYAALLLPLTGLSFQGAHLRVGELWVGVPLLLASVAAVVVLAVLSGVSSLARVVVTPLGVAARTTPARLSILRVVLAVAVLGTWIAVFGVFFRQQEVGVLLAILGVAVAVMNVVGPYVVMVAGLVMARFARTPTSLLAAHRIVDDPKATWRTVSALGLGICLAALSGVGSALARASDTPEAEALAVDLGTGALVALGICAVVAATSTGVAQAARVLDQRPQYRALALAGAPLDVLHRARHEEVSVPLVTTLLIGGAFPFLILIPLSAVAGPGVIVKATLAVVVACGLLLASVTASRGLVADAARL